MVEKNPADSNYEPLQKNLERLRAMKIDEEPVEIFICRCEEDFAGRADFAGELRELLHREQLRTPSDLRIQWMNLRAKPLQKLFPDRRVIGIDCRELIWGLGTFHCLTQQQPKV